MPENMSGKVAMITGAGSGLGKAAALRLAQAGVHIGALSRTRDEVEETIRQVRQAGSDGLALEADISNPEEMQTATRSLAEKFGRLDIVFANAGINGVWAPLEDLTPDEWDKTLDINLKGTFLTVKYALPYLKRQGGSVIITSSVNGTRTFSNTGATAYSCSKAAQVAFAQMTALELAKYKIRVNVICPGAITSEIDDNTERRKLAQAKEPVEYPEGAIPLTGGQPGTPEQVADLVYFLASDLSSHITGTPIWIDGGSTLLVG